MLVLLANVMLTRSGAGGPLVCILLVKFCFVIFLVAFLSFSNRFDSRFVAVLVFCF